jgi:small subunit ribosomal protein S2
MAEEKMLVDRADYLSAGVHIGMKSCTKYMKRFVYKVRDDGLSVFNLQKVNKRIASAVEFLSRHNNILIVSRKANAEKPITSLAKAIGGKAIAGRFSPGTLTNPSFPDFYEPDIVLVVDPLIDQQVITEARKKRIPIIALCDTFNECSDIDLVIPANNNGKKSLALIFWVLAKEISKAKKKKFTKKVEDFGYEEKPEKPELQEEPRRGFRREERRPRRRY